MRVCAQLPVVLGRVRRRAVVGSGGGTWPLTGAEASIGREVVGRACRGALAGGASPRSRSRSRPTSLPPGRSCSIASPPCVLPSATRPGRRALLGEGGHPLGLVRGCRRVGRRPRARRASPSPRPRSSAATDRRLRGPDGERRHRGDPRRRARARRRRSRRRGTTRVTRPSASASRAPIDRPVRISSIARALPIARVSRCVPPAPGMTPSRISGWPKVASSAATIMSQVIASSQPPPRAKPRTAAISGRPTAARRSQASNRPPSRSEADVCGASSRMSAPAAKARLPAPGDDDRAAASDRRRALRARRPARRAGRS